MSRIAATVAARGGHLIVDEIYLGLSYDGEPRSALTTAAANADDLFVVSSFSKYFNMTGWRLGWIVAPERHVRDLEKLAQNLYISPPTLSQRAALACFTPETLAIVEERRRAFRERRDFLVPALRELGFGIPVTPTGGFFVYADSSRFAADSERFCRDVLEGAGVAITPGHRLRSASRERACAFRVHDRNGEARGRRRAACGVSSATGHGRRWHECNGIAWLRANPRRRRFAVPLRPAIVALACGLGLAGCSAVEFYWQGFTGPARSSRARAADSGGRRLDVRRRAQGEARARAGDPRVREPRARAARQSQLHALRGSRPVRSSSGTCSPRPSCR